MQFLSRKAVDQCVPPVNAFRNHRGKRCPHPGANVVPTADLEAADLIRAHDLSAGKARAVEIETEAAAS